MITGYDARGKRKYKYDITEKDPSGKQIRVQRRGYTSYEDCKAAEDHVSSAIRSGNFEEGFEMKTTNKIESKIMLVTPQMAKEWLDKNLSNRNISIMIVNRYANDMKAGKWAVSPHGIVFDPDGNLLDGQHRLCAVIESGCPVKMVIITGADPGSKWFIDIGRKRGGNAVAEMLGVKNSSGISAMVQRIGEILTGAKTKRELPNDIAMEIYSRIGSDLPDYYRACINFCNAGSVKKSASLAAIYWLCCITYGNTKTNAVFEKIVAGYGLTPKSREAYVRKNVIMTPYIPGSKHNPGEGDLMRLTRAIVPIMAKGNTVESAVRSFRAAVAVIGIVELYENGFTRSSNLYNSVARKR